MKKLGVLVLATPDLGGTYQYSLSVLEALRHARHFKVTLYADPTNHDLINLGFPIRKFEESRAKQLVYVALDRLGLHPKDPFDDEDVLFAPIYSLALLHTKKPFAYTLHDLQELHHPANFSWKQRIWRRNVHSRLAPKADRIICESKYVKSDIVRKFHVPDEKVAVIQAPPLGEVLPEGSPGQLEEVRSRLGLNADFVFYPAQFWPHKNHFRLIAAFKLVVAKQPDVKLVLTGKARDGYAAVMQAIRDAGLTESVKYLGYIEQTDLQAVYRLTRALVMPSLFESVSIPIYEAFQSGTPVVASKIPSIAEQVDEAGLLFDPFSISSIAAGVLTVFGDPELADRLAARGRAKISSMTPQNHCRQLEDLLTDILATKSG